MALFEAAALKKNFGGLQAVQSFDFRMDSGEIVGLIGPNGSGKTTIFNVVTGIFPASGGSITFFNGPHRLVGPPAHVFPPLPIPPTPPHHPLFTHLPAHHNPLLPPPPL